MSAASRMEDRDVTPRDAIPMDEIRFASPYQQDFSGRVFEWNGHVYRGLSESGSEFYRDMVRKAPSAGLFDAGLVETYETQLCLDGFSCVLKHQRVPYVSFCMEWSGAMFRDAAVMLCDLALKIHQQGWTFMDAHPWNILFHGTRPVFVDLGSICAQRGQPWPYQEFRRYFVFPLYAIAAGRADIARAVMTRCLMSLNRGDAMRLILNRLPWRDVMTFRAMDNFFCRASRTPDEAFFLKLRDWLYRIPTHSAQTTWTAYESIGDRHGLEPPEKWPAKLRNVASVLDELKPPTVLDIGCNKGWFSELAAKKGADVAAMDVDEFSVNRLYDRARTADLPILPLFMDICLPTPSHGLTGGYRSALDRFRSDLVLSLATIHHIALGRGVRFDAILDTFSSVSAKALLVEFIPPEDRHVTGMLGRNAGWYRTEAFETALNSRFSSVRRMESSPGPRLLYLCTK